MNKLTYNELKKSVKELEKENNKLLKENIKLKKSEKSIRKIDQKYEELADLMPLALFEIDKKGNLTFVNRLAFNLFGYTQDNFDKHMNALELISPNDRKRSRENIRRVLNGEKLSGNEYTALRKNGSEFPIRIYSIPIIYENKIVGLRGVIIDNTEQKNIEKEIKKIQERFIGIYKSSKDAIGFANLKGVLLDVNNAFCELTGFSKKELIGKRYQDITPKRYRKNESEIIKKILRTGKPAEYEKEYIRKNGSHVPILLTTFVVKGDVGKPIGVAAIIKDITESKKLKDSLQKSEKQASAAIEAARALTFCYDIATGNIIWGGTIEEITKYTPEEFAKVDIQNWTDRIHPDDRDEILSILQEAMGKDRATAEYRFKTKKGYITLSSISITEKEDGKPVRLVGILQDITERKKAEEEKIKLLKAIETTKEAITIIDINLKMIYTNEAMDKLFGYKKGELIGKHVSIVNAGSLQKARKVPKIISNEIKNKGVWEGEIHNKRKDGTELISLANITALKNKEGEIINYVSTQHDITERRKKEEELKISHEKLRKLTEYLQNVREKERTFIAREIHDELGQALTALKMDLVSFKESVSTNKKSINEKIKSMLNIINGTIKTVQKISSELRPVILDELGLKPAIKWLTLRFQEKTGIKCNLLMDTEDIDFDPICSINIFRISQEILTNITRHSKATMVEVVFEENNGEIILSVKDNGIGIKEDQILSFNSLGLMGMRERVYSLNGKITIKGFPGKGTTITVITPIKRE